MSGGKVVFFFLFVWAERHEWTGEVPENCLGGWVLLVGARWMQAIHDVRGASVSPFFKSGCGELG